MFIHETQIAVQLGLVNRKVLLEPRARSEVDPLYALGSREGCDMAKVRLTPLVVPISIGGPSPAAQDDNVKGFIALTTG